MWWARPRTGPHFTKPPQQFRIPKPENLKAFPGQKVWTGRAATREDAYACKVEALRLAREVPDLAEDARDEEGSCQPR